MPFGAVPATLVNLTCQRWNASADRWVNQAGYTGEEPPTEPPPGGYHPACEPTCDQQIAALLDELAAIQAWLEEYPG